MARSKTRPAGTAQAAPVDAPPSSPPLMAREPERQDGAQASRQYVIFFVDDEAFAVSLAEVLEIIRMPEIVRLPLSPGSLEGLANLRGGVLPIVSTRRAFGLVDVTHDDATRVVILDQGRPVGLVVDRVANVVTVESASIESSRETGGVSADLLRGVIKDVAGYGMVMILDTTRLLDREFSALTAAKQQQEGGRLVTGGDTKTEAAARVEAVTAREMQLVSFDVAGQEYALPIESVQEIVQVPERITRVPKAAPSVVGVMNLRDRLLPIVSLRGLFELDPDQRAEDNRVVVVSIDRGGVSVGLVMDRVREVLRVPTSAVDPMPPLLAGEAELKEITSICRLDEGRRLVAILSAEAMLDSGMIQEAVSGAAAVAGIEGEQAMARVEGEGAATVADEQLVVFRLMNEEYAVTIDSVQEIVRVPADIARVPNTPDFIEGVINLRGTVVPLVDQRRRFGLPGCERNDRQRIVVFTIRGVRTGFIVDSVSEVMRIPRSKIGPAPELSDAQSRIIREVANLPESRRMILLIDTEEMLAADEAVELGRRAA